MQIRLRNVARKLLVCFRKEKLEAEISRGEIWLVNLNPTVGTEIRKTRPVIVTTQMPWVACRFGWLRH